MRSNLTLPNISKETQILIVKRKENREESKAKKERKVIQKVIESNSISPSVILLASAHILLASNF